ncbi:MAG: chorismate-binding protein [Crocinitomicaceae bacterium]|nr:chorismate-binding protein [Crocinitomicaceae bacterium]
MQTTLRYRFPGKSIVEQKGIFQRLTNVEDFNGFFLSDFEGNNFYGFVENGVGEAVGDFEKPIVLSQSAYTDLATEFIHYLQDIDIGKAILSRIKAVTLDVLTKEELFYQLEKNYPTAFVYLIDSPSIGTWIGATPETLVLIEDGVGKTMSLAGTKPSSDSTEWGRKEVEEQQMVTDFIRSILDSYCAHVEQSERKELQAGPVKHLVHHFGFKVEQKKEWKLIKHLHPTPAVSGFPRNKALKCIANFEPHERNFYAGMIGMKAPNKTHLFVNLRCGQILDNTLFLYVGGGLTQKSIAQHEWEETENKAKTIAIF